MASEVISPYKKDDSFLIENLLDLRSIKEAVFERAAQITPLVTEITIGPNSTYRCPGNETETDSPAIQEVSAPKTPKQKESPRQSSSKTSPITSSDLDAMKMKLYQESSERKVREKVQRQMEDRVEKDRLHAERQRKHVEEMKIEAERRYKVKMEKLEREIAMALKIEEQEEQKYQNLRSELTKNARKVIEQQEKELQENLRRYEDEFKKIESIFNQTIQACNQENAKVIEAHKKQFEAVKERKAGSRSLSGIKTACHEVTELCVSLRDANKMFEENLKAQKAQKEAEQKKLEAEAEKAKQVQLPVPSAPAVINSQSQLETQKVYSELMQILNNKQNATKQFREAAQLQNLRFALKMAVNAPINHLNEQNKNSLISGFQELEKLLSGQRVSTTKGEVSITDHPEANDWTKLRIAEKLIDVSDKKPETIFFVAAITVALWQQFPDFGQMFLAQLFKECPFLVPFKPGRSPNQSDIDFLRSWGYRVAEEPEKYQHYQSRTSKFASLLAAVWCTHTRRNVQAPHPCGIDNGWKFLINILKSDPDPMYLHLIDTIMAVAGSTLLLTYGKQFKKILVLIREKYLKTVESKVDVGMKGAFDRLELTLNKFFTEGKFPEPPNKLNPNFW